MAGYPIETRLASKNGYFTPAEGKKFYGKYSRTYLDVHWWNSPDKVQDSDHDNIVNYILGKAQRGIGSVNYVLSNTKITRVVDARNVAWATQGGNADGVSVEFSSHLNAEGHKKAGWLSNELFNVKDGLFRTSLKLRPHSASWKTQCPGNVDLARIAAEAKKWADGKYDPIPPPKPAPVPPATPIITNWSLWKETEQIYQFNKDTWLYDLSKATSWGTIKKVKAFNKDELVTIAGSFKNTKLDRTYYVTRYSFDKKIANGFHPDDLDIFVPPRPTPEPPKPPEVPPEVTEPELPETDDPISELPMDEMPSWFKSFLSKVSDFIKLILGRE